MASLFSPQLKRLLGYVRPYGLRLVTGVLLLAFVALAEGGVALMVAPAVDRVLNPAAVGSMLALVKLPWSGRTIYLNDFFPPRIHNVWTVFAFTLLILYFSKGSGGISRQYGNPVRGAGRGDRFAQPGLCAIDPATDGVLSTQSTGRLNSSVINDVERTRIALSEYLADLFQKGFTFLVFVVGAAGSELEDGAGMRSAFAAGDSAGK